MTTFILDQNRSQFFEEGAIIVYLSPATGRLRTGIITIAQTIYTTGLVEIAVESMGNFFSEFVGLSAIKRIL
jgi:hypothetical protein